MAILLGVLEYFSSHHLAPRHTVKILISTYEEVGHGMAWIPQDIQELIAVDMGCIGDDLSCTEQMVSICAKDSSGPYDYTITSRLAELAKENGTGLRAGYLSVLWFGRERGVKGRAGYSGRFDWPRRFCQPCV